MPTGITTAADLSPKVQAYYDKRFLLMAIPQLAFYQLGQKRPLPKNSGKTIYFSRYSPLPKRTTPLTETRNGGITDGKKIQVQELSATVAEYGDYVEISEIASLTNIDPTIKNKVDIVSEQASQSVEEIIKLEVGTGFMRRRADGNTSYQIDGIATGGTNNTLIDTANLTQANSYWNGGFVTFTNPLSPNYGKTAQISNFVSASNTLTLATNMPDPIGAGGYQETYRLVVGTGITASSKLTTAAIDLAVRDLKKNKALRMPDGGFVCVIDPDLELDFKNDPKWYNPATYKDKVDYLYNGEIGKWNNVRFVEATEVYRETVAGVYSESGDVHIATVLGREAFGVVDLEGNQKKIYIRQPEQLAQPIPMTSTIGWKVGFVAKVLNGCFGINLVCGATK